VNIEVLFKKYFYVGVGLLVALCAYFQAAGLSNIARSFLAPETGRTPPPSTHVGIDHLQKPSVRAIHERNPFDSVTGPLHAPLVEEAPVEETTPTFDDPLRVPACAGVEVLILTESDDPLWSFAALTAPTEKAPVLRRVGDKLGTQTVAYIGHNPATGSPTVWLESNTLCQASLFGVLPTPAAPAAAPAEEAADPAAAAPAPNARALDPDIASKIRKVSDTEFEIDRSAVDKILDNQADLMRSARIVPETKDGQTIGVRLFGIRPDTLLGQLGLTNGDRLETINDFNMASPEKALEAYARLRTANSLKIQVNRRGKPTTIELKIK
jgi:general secretion pathway protein C